LDVKNFNSLAVFEQVVELMSTAKQLDFYGSGVSNLICHDAMMKALRLGIPATAYSFYSEQAMLARTCPRDHLAIILSYTGQTEDTLRVAQYLKTGGVPSVSITSHTDNALLELCGINLFVDSFESVYRIGGMSSRLSSLHLLDILFSAYMNKNYDQLKTSVEKTFLPEAFHHLGERLEEKEQKG
ncbi:MAG: SIS domain-containing protein, partial [Pseudoflavonifractor sp.]